jgi:thioredoxin-related protein
MTFSNICRFLILFALFFAFSIGNIDAQKDLGNIYNPKADASVDLNKAIKKAQNENKHVLIQVGGNWCKWCISFHNFINSDKQIDSLIKSDYVFLLINYSKDYKNPEIMKRLEYPQRFGFPVLVVLDKTGKRIHTQDSGYLELDKSYDHDKVMTFLKNWSIKALDPNKYKN